jgi:hypothetical protein
MNTAIISILSALALIGAGYAIYQIQKRKQQAYWAKQFRHFMIARGVISWGEAQFIPNNPKEEYVTRMTGYKPTSRYWVTMDEAWRKRVQAMEED